MFMTDKELIRLTDYTYPSYQIKWLRDNGFTLITARRSPAPIVIPKEQAEALGLLPNAELSGPRPLAAEGSRSNDVLEGGAKGGDD